MTAPAESGWLRLYRKFFTSDLWEEKRELSKAEAFLWLLKKAEWHDKYRIFRGRRVLVRRGCLYASVRELMKEWDWKSPGRVTRFLESQVNAERIAYDSKTGHVTICNYGLYQGERNGDGTATEHERNADGTRSKKGRREEGEEGKKTSTPTRPAVAVGLDSIPDDLRRPEIEEAVREYVSYRGEAGFRALPASGWTKLWNRLAGLPAGEVVACFDRCIGSGNQGVFAPTGAKREPEGGSSRYRRIS